MTFKNWSRIILLALSIHAACSFELPWPDTISKVALDPGSCEFAQVVLNCEDSPYRTFDGTCNNKNNPWMGAANTPYTRLFAAAYRNASNLVVDSFDGINILPNPRQVTSALSNTTKCPDDKDWPNIFMIFGQFITHDIAQSAHSKNANGTDLTCPCGSPNPLCMPLPISDSQFPNDCMSMARLASADEILPGCSFGERLSVNTQTAFFDLSQVYGTSTEANNALRTFQRGKMNASAGVVSNCAYLPVDGDNMFISGDSRTNQNMGLASMHTLFLREHNRLAELIANWSETHNKSWDDEKIFQEARKCNIGQYQIIVYDEYLPMWIGNYSQIFSGDQRWTYDNSYDPQIPLEFAIMFRAGHSAIRDMFVVSGNQTRVPFTSDMLNTPLLSLTETTEWAYRIISQGLEQVLNGLFTAPMEHIDTCFSNFTRNNLVADPKNRSVVIDLPTTNLERSRDIGIPSYETVVNSLFGSSLPTISSALKSKLLSLYGNDEQIELYIGALAEDLLGPSVAVGPTAAVIIGKAFYDTRIGDRHFVTSSEFTNWEAFDKIQSIRMAHLVLANFPLTTSCPNSAFVLASRGSIVDASMAQPINSADIEEFYAEPA